MKHFKTFLSFLAIICCLAGSVAPVSASGGGSGDSGAAPRVVFTNESRNSPDLRVSKTVELSDPEHPAPEGARFRFLLELNGSAAKNVTYKVTDQEGEIIRKPDAFATDDAGIFTLEAGQTATFTYVGNNVPYTVTEQNTYLCPRKDEKGEQMYDSSLSLYRKGQTTPFRQEYDYQLRNMAADGYEHSGTIGSESGSVVADMPKVEFVNTYTDPSLTSNELKVTKTIDFPTEYEIPERMMDTDFGFWLDIEDGQNRAYTVLNSHNGDTTRTTDSYGSFYLYPGETAVFSDIPAGTGYHVQEWISEEGENWGLEMYGENGSWRVPFWWCPVGKTEWEGDQIPSNPITFRNTSSCFRVTKTMEDGSEPEDEFTFRLADANGTSMADVVYYRYGLLSKEIIPPEGTQYEWYDYNEGKWHPQQERLTDENGYFRLKAGEEAVFCGLPKDTSFTVEEMGHLIDNGERKDPSYKDQPSQSGTVNGTLHQLQFVNETQETEGVLTVNKLVENEGTEGPKGGDEFHFLLYRRLSTEDEVRSELKLSANDDLNVKMQDALSKNSAWKTVSTEDADGWHYTADGTNYEVWIPVDGVPYYIGDYSFTTGRKKEADDTSEWRAGEFAIEASQSARFQTLPAGRQYRIEEIRLTEEYRPKAARDLTPGQTVTAVVNGITQPVSRLSDGSYEYIQTASLTGDGLAFTFTNLYKPKKVDLKLVKTDETGTVRAGAEFMLYQDRGKNNPIFPSDEVLEAWYQNSEHYGDFRYVTGADGTLEIPIPPLKTGAASYWLYEEKAPSGYCVLEAPIQINITRTSEELTVQIDGKKYTRTDQDIDVQGIQNEAISGIKITKKSGVDLGGNDLNDEVILTIPNTELYELPSSGGIGIYWYSIGGTLLMLAASLILYKMKRQRRC